MFFLDDTQRTPARYVVAVLIQLTLKPWNACPVGLNVCLVSPDVVTFLDDSRPTLRTLKS